MDTYIPYLYKSWQILLAGPECIQTKCNIPVFANESEEHFSFLFTTLTSVVKTLQFVRFDFHNRLPICTLSTYCGLQSTDKLRMVILFPYPSGLENWGNFNISSNLELPTECWSCTNSVPRQFEQFHRLWTKQQVTTGNKWRQTPAINTCCAICIYCALF